MHANFHILRFFSANMAFSLAFAQTVQAFLSLSLALASSSKAFFAICLASFAISKAVISLSLASWRALWNLNILSEPKVQFHSHEDRLGYQPKQRKDI